MDLGRCDWASARSTQLVEPSVLASGTRTTKGNRTGTRRFGLGPLARTGTTTSFQPRVFAFCLARLERLWLWRSRRYGLLQFRHDFSRLETGGSYQCGSEFNGPLRGDLPNGVGYPLRLPGARR